MSEPWHWRTRPVEAADEPLLLRLYRSTREPELDLTGWTEAQKVDFALMQYRAQFAHYTLHWPEAEHVIIVAHRGAQAPADAGRLWMHRRGPALHLLDIALLPEWRQAGLGTQCMRDLTARAHGQGLGLSIYVETHNPAWRLYQRLGFQCEGEIHGIHQFMVWRPPAVQPMEI